MEITLTSKFNIGDKVHIGGYGGGVRLVVSSVSHGSRGFIYGFVGETWTAEEAELDYARTTTL